MPALSPLSRTPESFMPLISLRRLRPAALAAAFAVAGLVAGCGPSEDFPPACPALGLLPEAADITRYRAGGGHDLTDMVLDGRITAVPAKCQISETPNKVKATVQLAFEIGRGPAAKDRKVNLTYFIAITEGEKILDKQDYPLEAEFPANSDRVSVASPEVDLLIPVTAKKSAAAYKIYVGFGLTPDELAFNRQRGPR